MREEVTPSFCERGVKPTPRVFPPQKLHAVRFIVVDSFLLCAHFRVAPSLHPPLHIVLCTIPHPQCVCLRLPHPPLCLSDHITSHQACVKRLSGNLAQSVMRPLSAAKPQCLTSPPHHTTLHTRTGTQSHTSVHVPPRASGSRRATSARSARMFHLVCRSAPFQRAS